MAGVEHFLDDVVGGHRGEDLFDGGIVARRDGLFDILRRDHAAVAERNAHLLFIEGGFRKGNDGAVRHDGALIEEFLDDLAALDEVLPHDGFDMFGGHLSIERTLGIDDHDGAEGAEAEAARLDDEDVVDILLLQRLFEVFDDLHGVGRRAARAAADEDLFSVPRVLCHLLGLFADEAADVDKFLFAPAERV